MLAVELGRYKWYQSQTLDDVAIKGGRHEAVCQQGRWAPQGVGFGSGPTSIGERNGVPVKTKGVDLVMVPHRLVYCDGLEGGCIVMSHISWEENKSRENLPLADAF